MNFDEIKKEAEADLKIDHDNLDTASLEVPQKYQKYLDYFRQFSLAYKKKEEEKNVKYRELYEYYRDHYSVRLKNTEIEYYVKSEEDYIKINQDLNKLKSYIEYIEGILKQLSQMSFHISNAIAYRKFKEGIL